MKCTQVASSVAKQTARLVVEPPQTLAAPQNGRDVELRNTAVVLMALLNQQKINVVRRNMNHKLVLLECPCAVFLQDIGVEQGRSLGCNSTVSSYCYCVAHASASGSDLPSVNSANGGPSSSSTAFGVRWDLIASGVCVLVLLVAVLSVSGIMTYHYRQKQKERIRR